MLIAMLLILAGLCIAIWSYRHIRKIYDESYIEYLKSGVLMSKYDDDRVTLTMLVCSQGIALMFTGITALIICRWFI